MYVGLFSELIAYSDILNLQKCWLPSSRKPILDLRDLRTDNGGLTTTVRNALHLYLSLWMAFRFFSPPERI